MANLALNLAPFSRWTLRDKAAQRRLAPRYNNLIIIYQKIRENPYNPYHPCSISLTS